MADLSDTSTHSDPTYHPEPEELHKITKSKSKRKPTDDASQKSKRKASNGASQKSPIRTVSSSYEQRQVEKKKRGIAKTKTELEVAHYRKRLLKTNKQSKKKKKPLKKDLEKESKVLR